MRIGGLPAGMLVFAALLLAPLGALGAELDTHHRALLLAQLEDLQRRLTSAETPDSLPGSAAALVAPDLDHEQRIQAGLTMHRRELRLEGTAEFITAWLTDAGRAHMAARPPLSLRSLPGPGRRVALRISLWWLAPAKLATAAPAQELSDLRDNLLWLERHLGEAEAMARFLGPLADSEGVRLDEARWEAGQMKLSGLALDQATLEAYRQFIEDRKAALKSPPELDLALAVAPAPEGALPPTGLLLRDLPAEDAVLLAASLSGQELVLAAPPLPPLSGHLVSPERADLLKVVLGKLPLARAAFGAIQILAPELTPKAPPQPDVGEAPLELIARAETAQAILARIAATARVGLIASARPDRQLTVALKRRSAKQVAQIICWALGLVPWGDSHLLTALPAGRTPPPASGPSASIKAVDAPIGPVLAGLTGLDAVRVCPPAVGDLTLAVGAVSSAQLVWALLQAHDRRLVQEGRNGRLETAGAKPTPCPEPSAAAAERAPRLAAILGASEGYRALIIGAAGASWLQEGQALPDGQRALRIRGNRVLLGRSASEAKNLFLQPDALPRAADRRLGPTRQGLADLRLAATALVTGTQPLALLQDRTGLVHQVRQGDGVGWRCGRVKSILPGRVVIAIGCGRPHEPKEVTLHLRPAD